MFSTSVLINTNESERWSWCDVWNMYVYKSTVVNSLERYLGRTHSRSSFHSPRTKHLESGTQPKCYGLIRWNRALDLWLQEVHLCRALFVFPLHLIPQLLGLRNVSSQNDAWCLVRWQEQKKKTLTHTHTRTLNTHTHKYFCFYWSPWSHYQHAKRGLWLPKVLRRNACFPVCLNSLMFKRRCATTESQSREFHVSFFKQLEQQSVADAEKSTPVNRYIYLLWLYPNVWYLFNCASCRSYKVHFLPVWTQIGGKKLTNPNVLAPAHPQRLNLQPDELTSF